VLFSIEDKYIQEFALRAIDASNASSSYQSNISSLASPTIFRNLNLPDRNLRLARLDSRSSVDAVLGGALGDRLGLVARGGTLELLADSLDVGSTSTSNGSSSAKVGVDASKDLSVVGLDVLDDNTAGNRVLAVTACAVELAEVHDS
jgi:hypothetical protein